MFVKTSLKQSFLDSNLLSDAPLNFILFNKFLLGAYKKHTSSFKMRCTKRAILDFTRSEETAEGIVLFSIIKDRVDTFKYR